MHYLAAERRSAEALAGLQGSPFSLMPRCTDNKDIATYEHGALGRMLEQPECPLCGSRIMGALKPWGKV